MKSDKRKILEKEEYLLMFFEIVRKEKVSREDFIEEKTHKELKLRLKSVDRSIKFQAKRELRKLSNNIGEKLQRLKTLPLTNHSFLENKKRKYSVNYRGILEYISEEFFNKNLEEIAFSPFKDLKTSEVYSKATLPLRENLLSELKVFLLNVVIEKLKGESLKELFEGFVLHISLTDPLACRFPQVFFFECKSYYFKKINNPFIDIRAFLRFHHLS